MILAIWAAALGGCTRGENPWSLQSIATGEKSFDSSRLIYNDPLSPLRLEIVHLGSEILSFVSLTKYTFTPAEEVLVAIDIEGEKSEESAPCLEGKMRLKLPASLSQKIIDALQEGKEIAIMLDGFEQRLNPAHFPSLYKKLAGHTPGTENPFKGLFDP